MNQKDDGDIIRGLGFITIYAAWLEEDVDDLLRMMDPIEAFDQTKQRLPISQKLKHAANIVRKLNNPTLVKLPDALEQAVILFDRRNQFCTRSYIRWIQPYCLCSKWSAKCANDFHNIC